MLTRLALTEFKSWHTTGDVRLAPITGFFGGNSSGKTSLLQALLLLKQTAASSDRGQPLHFGDHGSLVDLGDFMGLVHQHDAGRKVVMDLDWQQSEPFQVWDPTKSQNEAVLSSRLMGFSTEVALARRAGPKLRRVRVQRMTYRVGDGRFGMALKDEVKEEYDLFAEGTSFEFKRTRGRPWELPAPVKCYGFPDEARAYFKNAGFLADLQLALERRLKGMAYLGPLRAHPARQYPWSGAQPEDMGAAGDKAIDAILTARERGLTISRGRGRSRATLEEYVADWLRRLGLIESFRVEPISEGGQLYRVPVRRSEGSAEVLITDVGFGVSQILPVLVLCFYVPEGSTVILEQPEIHLHPAVQAGLADVFIDAWKTRNVQVLVESHSEHLLRRLQRRIAEEVIEARDTALYFSTVEKGQSMLTPLAMNMFGSIENWPPEFFGNEFGEIAAMMEKIQERKKSAGK